MTARKLNLLSSGPATSAVANKVTVLYEDFSAGQRAKALLDCVFSKMNLPQDLDLDFLRFDMLRYPALQRQVEKRAGVSVMVVLSLGSLDAPPSGVETGLNNWMHGRKHNHSALVVLLPTSEDRSPEIEKALARWRRAAKENGVDLLCESHEPEVASKILITQHHHGLGNQRIRTARHALSGECEKGRVGSPPKGDGKRGAQIEQELAAAVHSI